MGVRRRLKQTPEAHHFHELLNFSPHERWSGRVLVYVINQLRWPKRGDSTWSIGQHVKLNNISSQEFEEMEQVKMKWIRIGFPELAGTANKTNIK
jgi:hypothetical protein